jgi:hypothetical protein
MHGATIKIKNLIFILNNLASPISSIYYFQPPVNFSCPIPPKGTVTMNMSTAATRVPRIEVNGRNKNICC